MTRGGHNRKTTTQAKLDGTARADRHGEPVTVTGGDVVPPPELSPEALAVWERYISPRTAVGFYEPAEAPLLGLWCMLMIRTYQADDIVPPGGVYSKSDGYGGESFAKHPAVAALLGFSAEFRSLTARLGLDPVSRMALADLGATDTADGPQLPAGAPPAWTPKIAG